MLFYNRVKKHHSGSNAVIDAYLERNERAFLFSVARSMRQEVIEKDVLTSLGKQRIPACIIKGNEIARIIYEDPNSRSSADIDVLIQAKDLACADQTLQTMGFLRSDSLPLTFVTGRLHHLVYYNTEKVCHLELHWDFGYPSYFNMTPEDIWKDITGNPSDGYSLTPQNMIIMLLTHHFRHGFREFKILVDILWCFYRYDKVISWPTFAEKLRQYGLVKTTKIILDQMDELWRLNDGPLESFPILRRQLAKMPIRPPNFLQHYFRMDIENPTNKKTDMQMAKLVIDRKANVFYSFVKIFFPRPREIKAFYPKSGTWMLPVNYLKFICWRVTNFRIFAK